MLPQSGTRILFPSGTISTPSLYHFAGSTSSSSPPTRSGFSFRPEQSQHHPCTTLREHRPPQPQSRRWRSPPPPRSCPAAGCFVLYQIPWIAWLDLIAVVEPLHLRL